MAFSSKEVQKLMQKTILYTVYTGLVTILTTIVGSLFIWSEYVWFFTCGTC